MKQTLVIGHKNPDSDSICSAKAYAALKNHLAGEERYLAARCGSLNKQTRYIFDRFNAVSPHFVKDVYPKVEGVMTAEVNRVGENTPLMEVMSQAELLKIRSQPVVDEKGALLGMITLTDLTHFFLAGTGDQRPKYPLRPRNLNQVLQGDCLQEGEVAELEAVLIAGAMSEHRFSERFSEIDASACLLVVGCREELVIEAVKRQIPILILTGIERGEKPMEAILKDFKGWVFVSENDTADTLRRVALAVHAGAVMSPVPALAPSDYLDEASKVISDGDHKSLPVLNEEGALVGIFSKSDMIKKEPQRLILMDHNEMSQAVDGADGAEIVEIVDHHRLGTIKTKNPVHFFAKPVGSTCTLVFQQYLINGVSLDQETAALLLCGVLTDTVILKSPTSTEDDRRAIEELARIAGEDWQQLGIDLFSATDSLKTRAPEDVIATDFKCFTEYGTDFGIGQVEVVTLEDLAEVEDGLREGLLSVKAEKGLGIAMLLVTDIIKETSILYSTPHPGFEKAVAYKKLGEGRFDLPSVLSRKKQLLPEVLRVFEELTA